VLRANNQGLLKLTSYFDSLNSLTFYYLLFFRCQLYVFYSCVDKCLSSKVDAERKTIIFNVLLNSKKITDQNNLLILKVLDYYFYSLLNLVDSRF
jgi:hypothetical protein